jgi:hypothetical protein
MVLHSDSPTGACFKQIAVITEAGGSGGGSGPGVGTLGTGFITPDSACDPQNVTLWITNSKVLDLTHA